jgi:hypothetical protein
MSTAGDLEVLEASRSLRRVSYESLVDRSRPNNSSQETALDPARVSIGRFSKDNDSEEAGTRHALRVQATNNGPRDQERVRSLSFRNRPRLTVDIRRGETGE